MSAMRNAVPSSNSMKVDRLRWRLLTALDRLFPPNRQAFMSPDRQTEHEVAKASATVGAYLAELGDSHALSKDGRLPFGDRSFDAVLSTDTFEHVMDLDLAFSEIARVLRPGGSLLTRFGPLFNSPHGYHLYWACQVPYAHLLFGLRSIAAMRAGRGGSRERPSSWQDLGLNGKRFRDYAASVERAGLEIVRFRPVPVKGLKALASLPFVGDLLIFGIDCHVRRPKDRQ